MEKIQHKELEKGTTIKICVFDLHKKNENQYGIFQVEPNGMRNSVDSLMA